MTEYVATRRPGQGGLQDRMASGEGGRPHAGSAITDGRCTNDVRGTMQYGTLAEYKFQPTSNPGSEKFEIWRGGANAYTVAYRVKKGVVFEPHGHPGWEQLTVVSGSWKVDDRVLGPGDVAITPPLQKHREEAIEDTLVIISVGNNDLTG